MTAKFEFLRADSASIRSLTQDVLWWYHPGERRWFLDAAALPPF